MFKVGQKVVCVDDSPGWADGEKTLVKDKVYTVLGLNNSISGAALKKYGPDLYVQPNEDSWCNIRFKPLVDDWVEQLLNEIAEDVEIEV